MYLRQNRRIQSIAPSLVDCTAALIASPSMLLNRSLGVKTAITVKIATLVLAAPMPPGGFHMMTLSSFFLVLVLAGGGNGKIM